MEKKPLNEKSLEKVSGGVSHAFFCRYCGTDFETAQYYNEHLPCPQDPSNRGVKPLGSVKELEP